VDRTAAKLTEEREQPVAHDSDAVGGRHLPRRLLQVDRPTSERLLDRGRVHIDQLTAADRDVGHRAAEEGRTEAVRLGLGFALETRGDDGGTPLHAASYARQRRVRPAPAGSRRRQERPRRQAGTARRSTPTLRPKGSRWLSTIPSRPATRSPASCVPTASPTSTPRASSDQPRLQTPAERCGCGVRAELAFIQRRVRPAAVDEARVGAAIDDAAAVEDEDEVGGEHGDSRCAIISEVRPVNSGRRAACTARRPCPDQGSLAVMVTAALRAASDSICSSQAVPLADKVRWLRAAHGRAGPNRSGGPTTRGAVGLAARSRRRQHARRAQCRRLDVHVDRAARPRRCAERAARRGAHQQRAQVRGVPPPFLHLRRGHR
jgi:hypothetical protein